MDVVIQKVDEYNLNKLKNVIGQALNKINFKVKPKSKVLIKPNLLTAAEPTKSVTTHPVFLEAICSILKDCELYIGESPGNHMQSFKHVCNVTGVTDVAKRYNAKLINFNAEPITKSVGKLSGQELYITKFIKEVDLVINLPKLKTHSLMLYTGAVKNLFGLVPGGKKAQYHATNKSKDDFARLLIDICLNAKPSLTIMDGIIAMEGNGPSNGQPKRLGLVIVSRNPFALDYVVGRMIGFNNKVYTTKLALKEKLIAPNRVNVIGPFFKIKLKKPTTYANSLPMWLSGLVLGKLTPYPKIDHSKCKQCWVCVNVCPVQAMIKKNKYPVCKKKECIACYCCHELCPHNAIILSGGLLYNIAKKIVALYYKKT